MRLSHLLTAIALSALSACQWNSRQPISGTVNIDPALLGKARQPNAVLLIVARNTGDVPVAVKEIVSPEFPQTFTIGPEDLVLPDAWSDDLRITAQLATRMGADGLPIPEAGDTAAVPVSRTGEPLNVFIPTAKPQAWTTAKSLALRGDTQVETH